MVRLVNPKSGAAVNVDDVTAGRLVGDGWQADGASVAPVEAVVEAPEPEAEADAKTASGPAEPEKRKPGRPRKD